MGFGVKLKELLNQRGITIKELSEKTGISINTLYSITRRDTRVPSQDVLDKIANILGPDVYNLLTYEEMNKKIKELMREEEETESSLRKALGNLLDLLNGFGLSILFDNAVELLQKEEYRSFKADRIVEKPNRPR